MPRTPRDNDQPRPGPDQAIYFPDLIKAVKAANGWTDRDLEERSGILAKWWNQRANQTPPMRNWPDMPMIPKIADGLGVPRRRVVASIDALFYGPDQPDPLLVTLLPAGLDLLPEEIAYDRAAMLRRDVATAREIAGLRAELEEARKPTPRKR